MRTIGIVLTVSALASACGVTPTPPAEASAESSNAAKSCYEDTPTGTRFGRTVCMSAKQQVAKDEEAHRAGDDLRRIRDGSNPERR